MIKLFYKQIHLFLQEKRGFSSSNRLLLAISRLHTISSQWKQSHTAIHRKKRNIEKQKKLKEERSLNTCDPVIGFPTDFIRSILYPKDIFISETNPTTNNANFFFSNEELDTIYKIAKEANLRRLGLSSLMVSDDYLTELKEKVSQYIDISQQTTDIQSLLELLSKNEKIQKLLDSTDHKDKNHIIIKLASICKIQKICKQEDKKANVMKRIMSLENSNSKAIQLQNIAMAVDRFKLHKSDTGSPEVQAAVFTVRIHYLNFHLSSHHKDKNSFRALRHLVHKRQAILKYLRKENQTRYFSCIEKLGLTDNAVINEITM